jgi:ABC-2 type transport system permease protein
MSSLLCYLGILKTFAKNSLMREMSFRANFIFQCISGIGWTMMNVGLYLIVFSFTDSIGVRTGWGKWEFFLFLATTWIINSIVQAFFMPNAEEFSELIRTGGLDFALLKPIDTQFLVSFQKIDWSSLANLFVGLALGSISLWQLTTRDAQPLTITVGSVSGYCLFVAVGIAILYSLMVSLSATSVWLGKNQSLYDFWFYITNFSRYPMEIYQRGWGWSLWGLFTFVIPVLVVVNVPARILARPLADTNAHRGLALFALVVAPMSLLFSRWIFQRAITSYRSAG